MSPPRSAREPVAGPRVAEPGGFAGLAGAAPGVVGAVRRRPGWVWGGASLVVASAVGVAALVAVAGERESVLAVVRDLPAGHVIEPGDVRVVRVAADGGVVPAGQAQAVIGRLAAVPLAGGSLLAPGQVGQEAAYPPQGYSEVSFAVAPGDAPRLEPGQRVAVFPGPAAGGVLAGEEEVVVEPVVGTVTQVAEGDAAEEAVVVSVLVEAVAAQRAAGLEQPRVVVLAAPGGGQG